MNIADACCRREAEEGRKYGIEDQHSASSKDDDDDDLHGPVLHCKT